MSATEFSSNRRVLNVPDAAAYVGLSKSTLDKKHLAGDGPRFVKLGARVVYRLADLDTWINDNVRRSTSDEGNG